MSSNSSYTAQLFESLMRASAETPTAKRGYPPPSAVENVFAGGGKERSPSAGDAASVASGGVSSDALPHELDECYAVIRFQRAQISQLRGRTMVLEEQLHQVRGQREVAAT